MANYEPKSPGVLVGHTQKVNTGVERVGGKHPEHLLPWIRKQLRTELEKRRKSSRYVALYFCVYWLYLFLLLEVINLEKTLL